MKHYKPIWKGPDSIYDFKFQPVSEFFVTQQLLNLSQHSNNDIHGFDCKLLQICADVIAGYVTLLINKSLMSATVTEDWKQSRVTPTL